jgi:hypothetical protein
LIATSRRGQALVEDVPRLTRGPGQQATLTPLLIAEITLWHDPVEREFLHQGKSWRATGLATDIGNPVLMTREQTWMRGQRLRNQCKPADGRGLIDRFGRNREVRLLRQIPFLDLDGHARLAVQNADQLPASRGARIVSRNRSRIPWRIPKAAFCLRHRGPYLSTICLASSDSGGSSGQGRPLQRPQPRRRRAAAPPCRTCPRLHSRSHGGFR